MRARGTIRFATVLDVPDEPQVKKCVSFSDRPERADPASSAIGSDKSSERNLMSMGFGKYVDLPDRLHVKKDRQFNDAAGTSVAAISSMGGRNIYIYIWVDAYQQRLWLGVGG